METTIVKTILDFGGLGLAALLAFILYRILNNHLSHLQGAIEKNTEVLNDLRNSITRLTDFLDGKFSK